MGRGKGRGVPRLCQRKDGRHYVTDPATKKQVPMRNRADYAAWVQEFLTRDPDRTPAVPPRCSVAQLLNAYRVHAEGYYRKRGRPTSHLSRVKMAAAAVLEVWGPSRPAGSVGGPDLEAVKQHLIRRGYVRKTINTLLRIVVAVWKWGVAQNAVDPAALGRMQAVGMVKRGRTEARDRPKVKPVPPEHVEATLPQLRQPYADMVRLQLYSGLRPGEVVALQPCDVDRSTLPWIYRVDPEWDKTEHRKGDRDEGERVEVYFGPKAREILGPRLEGADPDAPLFRSATRRTPVTEENYRHRIAAAARRAGVPRWKPNQLRHNRATEIRARYGLEAAQVILRHANANVSELYAERDAGLARRVAEESG